MRLFFACKQFCTRRDFIGERYGRLWKLPAELARRGHQVAGLSASYYAGFAPGRSETFGDSGTLEWRARRVFPSWPPQLVGYLRQLHSDASAFRPHAVVVSSDAFQLWAGRWLSRRLAVPLVVDFYDNYESFGLSRLPGARLALREAARAAAGLTFVSDPLREHLVDRYGIRAPAITLENSIDESFLSVATREGARQELGLPAAGRLVGTAGSLDASRNVCALYGAFEALAAEDRQLHLVLAGEPQQVEPPAHPRVIRMGTLAPSRMPAFWRALDVAAIGLRDDAFGRYCYPLKLAEIAAVGTPMIFPSIGIFARSDAGQYGVAAASNDAAGMAEALSRQLAHPVPPAWRPQTWAAAAARFEALLVSALAGHA